MTNHYHLVVETPDANLSKGMRQLNGVYTQTFNRRHGLVGHLFQGRFKGILIERDSYLLELGRYVVLNPVRAGMVADAVAWEWSSYRSMLGITPAPSWLETDWLLGQFGTSRDSAVTGYAAFVAAGVGQPSIWQGLRHQIFLGREGFAEQFIGDDGTSSSLREVPRAQRRALAPPLAQIEASHSDRRDAMAQAFLTGAYAMQEIADHFGVHYSTVSRAVKRAERADA